MPFWHPPVMDHSAWDEVEAAIAAAPYPVRALPPDPDRARAGLALLGISTATWLGAVVVNTGGLLVDHGWLRVLGSGGEGLPDVTAEADPEMGGLIVAYDVLGGQFAWVPARPGTRPTVHHFGPPNLTWVDLRQGYADWLNAVLAGALTRFYDAVRWPGWEREVGALPADRGRTAPLLELAARHQEAAEERTC